MLSILIVNWNTRELLRACLRSIENFPCSEPYETIVVDNASTDGSAAMVAEQFPWVRLIASDKNSGYAGGNNAAYEAAKGEWILLLNPDTEFLDNSLDKALSIMKSMPEYGALGARQVLPDGSTQRSVRGFPSFLGILGDLFKIRSGSFDSYRLTRFDYDQAQDAPQPMGTFLLLRKEALEDPLFDPQFPIFFNEVDLLYRMAQKGWKCFYSPDVRILHHGGESTKQVKKGMIWESHRSLVRFLRKHRRTGWNFIMIELLAGIIYAGAWLRGKGYVHPFKIK